MQDPKINTPPLTYFFTEDPKGGFKLVLTALDKELLHVFLPKEDGQELIEIINAWLRYNSQRAHRLAKAIENNYIVAPEGQELPQDAKEHNKVIFGLIHDLLPLYGHD